LLICGIKKLKLAWYIASWKIAIGCYLLIKKFNLWLKRKIQPVVEAPSGKLQAASNA